MVRHLPFLLPLPLLLAAKADKAAPALPEGPSAVPLSTLILRNSFDTDPTEYIGAFVMQEGAVPDEARAARLACSNFVSWKEVGGGDVQMKDVFTASAGAALKLGVPPVAGVDAGAQRSVSLLVQYTATKKWQAVVEDPAGFATCCATYPDQCRSTYVGDFLGGTGKIYSEVVASARGKGGGASGTVGGEVVAYGGKQWTYVNEFPNEVAFAFKLKDAPLPRPSDDPICQTDWRRNVPNDTRGHWEVAVSDVFPDEAGARADAWDKAALQVAKWCGADVSVIDLGQRSDASDGRDPASALTRDQTWSVTAQAMVQRMRLVCSEPERAEGPRGYQYKLPGLYLLPQAQLSATCEEAVRALGRSRDAAAPTAAPRDAAPAAPTLGAPR